MDIFNALAEPTRRDILQLLASSGELSASEISGNFTISSPAVSQHLKVLKETKLVKMKKQGQQRIYGINTEAFDELKEWTEKVMNLWNQRFDAIDKLLEEEKQKLK